MYCIQKHIQPLDQMNTRCNECAIIQVINGMGVSVCVCVCVCGGGVDLFK